jgi:hypothetical protein
MSEAVNAAEQYLSARRSTSVDELLDFLRIPSISSLPEHETTSGEQPGGQPSVYGAQGWSTSRYFPRAATRWSTGIGCMPRADQPC